MKKSVLILLALSSIVFAKEVTVSILPQKYFVEKIAKDKLEVNVMVTPGSSPATYEPKVSQMKKLAKSKAYFAIDVPFEKAWLPKFEAANKNMLIVDTADGIEKIAMLAHHHHGEEHHDHEEKAEKHHDEHSEHAKHEEEHHEHGKHEDEDHEEHHEGHVHTGLDPHIWLDPILVKTQAKNIFEALVKIDSKNKEFYKTNYIAFVKELDNLNSKIEKMLKPHKGKAFMIFHPAWGYFAKRYDLKQIAIEMEGKEPKPAQLVHLVDEAKEHNIKIVFVSPQFSQKGAKTISKSIKGNVAIMNPLSYKWKENLIKVASDIANTYK